MQEKKIYIDEKSVLLIDKPLRWTSFDVVKKLRYLLGVKKIGHAGTLDPLATGLLLLCTGRGTKRLGSYQGLDKSYEGSLVLGKTTPSYDLETPFDSETSYAHLQEAEIHEVSKAFLGKQKQLPPSYSACKIAGVPAYKKARKGQDVTLQPREVTISQFELTAIDLPRIDFTVTCSKGTYIRSLVHDFGQKLGVGAHLSALRRTTIGPYSVKESYTIPFLVERAKAGQIVLLTSSSDQTT